MLNRFFQWGRKGLQEGFALLSTLVTGLCPVVLKYVQHIFTGGPKFFWLVTGLVLAHSAA